MKRSSRARPHVHRAWRQWLIICLSIGNAEIIIPFKRKRKKKGEPKDELTEQQKEANTALASARISIEHSNAGFKRNRSVTDILRNTGPSMSDSLALVAMGLHNLRVSMRASYQC
jgi:DDE superfamily endonuclease